MSESEQLSKKPEDSDFQQQRLKAWQPLLTPKWVIGTFILIGVIFIPIGIAIVVSSGKVVEIEHRYDNLGYDTVGGKSTRFPGAFPPTCTGLTPPGCSSGSTDCKLSGIDYPNPYASTAPDYSNVDNCMIDVTITVDKDMPAPVYMYYKLSNFFQNHRRYVKSRSDTQLANAASVDTSTCDPWSKDATQKPYYPCGLIAGSFFVDRFSVSVVRDIGGTKTPIMSGTWDKPNSEFQKDGIAWSSDKKDKFKPNVANYASGNYNLQGILGAQLPAVDDEDFIVWMRTAGLPTFKKLYRKINVDLKAGDIITVKTLNYYPVNQFSGQKAIVFSTTSWLGGKNSFLGWAYIVVGIICILLAVAFLIKHLVSPRPLGDMKFFHWPAQPVRQ